MGYHSLVFKGSHDTKEIAKINDLDEANHLKSNQEILNEVDLLIHAFCADFNFKIHYIRFWNRDSTTVFDVGSHSEFFYLSPAIDFSNDKGGDQDG